VYIASHPGAWLLAEVTRRLGPVVRVPWLGALVSEPAIAWTLLQDDERFTKAGPGSVGALVTQVMGGHALINMDGAPHRELRDRLRSLFAPSCVDALAREAFSEPLCSLQAALARGEVIDLVAFMHELTGRVTCRMLGVDPDDEAAFGDIVALGQRLSAGVELAARALPPRRVAQLRQEFERLVAYAAPGSFASRLAELGLSESEVKGVLGTLLLVGTQTTSVAVPRIVALLLDTGEWSRLRADRGLLGSAVDEGLRCTVPVPATIRSVARDSEVHGHRFREGSRAFVFTYNLAKHPRLFPDPGVFDIARRCAEPRARHLWYGHGPHFCLGFALAQREIAAVLEALLDVPGELRVVRRRAARGVLLPSYARLEVALR
jgi:cytochrome P450